MQHMSRNKICITVWRKVGSIRKDRNKNKNKIVCILVMGKAGYQFGSQQATACLHALRFLLLANKRDTMISFIVVPA